MSETAVLASVAAELPAGRVLTGAAYERSRRVWNGVVDHAPAVIVRPETTAEVAAALAAARRNGLPISVRGGGHDWAGRAIRDGAMVIDLGALRTVEIDGDVARVGGGATADDLLGAAGDHGLSAAVGTVGSVGVVGLILGGGYSPLIGVVGLGVDNVLSAEVVLADGSVVTADRESEPELFWALRGGGGNFGVVTHISLRLHPIRVVTAGTVAFALPQARHVLRGLSVLHDQMDDALDVMFGAMHTPAGAVLFTTPMWAGVAEAGAGQIDRVRTLGDPVLDDVGRRAVADVARTVADGFPAGGHYRLSSRITPPIDDAFIDAFVACADVMPDSCALNVHHSHGAATRVPVVATAHAYRDPHLVIEILGVWGAGDGRAERAWVSDSEHRLDGIAVPGGWTNLMAPDDPRARDAYGPNTARLVAAKKRYDPDGVFNGIPLPPVSAFRGEGAQRCELRGIQ
jgi:FAD/FMN-containing dehydrogenase